MPREFKAKFWPIFNLGTLIGNPYAAMVGNQLVLAQHYIYNHRYQQAILNIKHWNGTRFILDNGAHENERVDNDDYLQVVLRLNPWAFVLPDIVLGSAVESRILGFEFLTKVREVWAGVDEEAMFFYAPQGRTPEETLQEYQWAIETLNPRRYIVCFGQSYLAWLEDASEKDVELRREQLFTEVMEIKGSENFMYHILGGRWKPTAMYGNHPRVVGLDSIKPCRCALEDKVYPAKAQCFTYILSDERTAVDTLAHNIAEFCNLYALELPDDHDKAVNTLVQH